MMNDLNSSQNLTSQLFKNSQMLASSPEMLSQHLLCMSNILSINHPIQASTSTVLPQFSKEQQQQLTQYQMARMRFNQELLNSNSFYHNFPYNFTPYVDLTTKNEPNLTNYSRVENNRYRYLEEPKPQHSYIGLIAIAILSMPDQKMVLADIYQNILDNYPYFRNRGPGWRNSIRHNLSLNDCFIKAGRSANGKGHYWAIHPANLEDFKKGDFRRRKAQRKVRRHMGLSVPDDDEDDDDSPVPSPTPVPEKVSPCNSNLLAPNPFVQAMSTPLFGASNSNFSQHAFNLFNSLRFAFPASSTASLNSAVNFNETLYQQLINLNIKQDLHSNGKSINSNRKEFSIESLLSNKWPDNNDVDSELDDCRTLPRVPEDETSCEMTDEPQTHTIRSHVEEEEEEEEEEEDRQLELDKSQPVNLKINSI